MKQLIAITACALTAPAALAATRTYDTAAFDGVAVAAGVVADITVGPTRSVTAETRADNFDDLRITVDGNVLKIDRPRRNWLSGWFRSRPAYKVHVVTPRLQTLEAASGAEVMVKGNIEGDFSVAASSGSDVDISRLKAGHLKAAVSSGSELEMAGSCGSLQAEASSGSDLDAGDLRCENATVRASSGSDLRILVTKRVTGSASSGADVRIRGNPAEVRVETSSGAEVDVKP